MQDQPPFEEELKSVKVIYEELRKFPPHVQDRMQKLVMDQLSRERAARHRDYHLAKMLQP